MQEQRSAVHCYIAQHCFTCYILHSVHVLDNYEQYTAVQHYTANSIKVVFPIEETVNYERARDDGLLFILALIHGELPL